MGKTEKIVFLGVWGKIENLNFIYGEFAIIEITNQYY